MNPDILAWALAQPAGSMWEKIASAYSTGALRVETGGSSVTYRSLDEMVRILTAGYAAAASAAGASRRPSMTLADFRTSL